MRQIAARPIAVARRSARRLEMVWAADVSFRWPLTVTALSMLVLALGFVDPAPVYDPALRAAAETAITLCALAATLLLSVQFAHSHKLRDLRLLTGLLMLAFLHLVSYAVPSMLNLSAGGSFAAAALYGNVFAGATFAAAAFTPSDRVLDFRGGLRSIAVGLAVLAVGVAELGGLLVHANLVPVATRPAEGVGSASAHPLGVALVVVAAGLFGLTAVVFARRDHTDEPRFIPQLAGASVLLAAAGLYGLALPALLPNRLAPGLALRLFAWALIFIAAVSREIDERARSRLAAVTAERRRLAGNLHDGLAQDLAFIVSHGALLARHLGAEHPLTVAAGRALAVSRTAITELQDPSGSAHEALRTVTRTLSDRFGIEIALDGHLDTGLDPDLCEHVVRIAREAIVNAARHGHAEHVSVSLERNGEGVVLRVRDDGCGITHTARNRTRQGYGLRSMRERAAAGGGHLILSEPDSGGTELEALLRFPRHDAD